MRTPGSNLLRRASRLIAFQTVEYYSATGRTLNAARQYVPEFSVPFRLQASVQAVNRNNYHEMGLDLNKFYLKILASIDIVDLQRDSSGDRFIYGCDLFQLDSGTTWFAQDGWARCIGVRIKTGAKGPYV